MERKIKGELQNFQMNCEKKRLMKLIFLVTVKGKKNEGLTIMYILLGDKSNKISTNMFANYQYYIYMQQIIEY